MATKKYRGVSRDKNGKIFYQTEFGVDPETGKRRRKKSYKDKDGNPFKSEKQAFDELCRIRVEFAQQNNSKVCTLTFSEIYG